MKDRRIWIIFLIVFINLLGFGIVLPLLPYYAESLGASPIMIGIITAAYSLFQLLSAPILGELSDKLGRRPILLISIAGTAISFLLLGVANSIPILIIARIIDGASGGNISTAQAYIADITTKENRTQGMGIMMAAFGLGFILGPALGGILSVYGYGVPAIVAGVIAILATIVTFFFLPESIPASKTAQVINKKKILFSIHDFYDALTHPDVGVILIIFFFTMTAFSVMTGTFSLYTEHTLKLSAEDNGFLFALIGLIGVLVQIFVLKRFVKFFQEERATTISIIIMAFSLAFIAIGNNIYIIIISVALLAFGNAIIGPVLSALVSIHTPAEEQGNIMGIYQSVGSLARLVGPLIGTFFYGFVSIDSPYYFGAFMLIIAVLISMKYMENKAKSPVPQ